MIETCKICDVTGSYELRLETPCGSVQRCTYCDVWSLDDGQLEPEPDFQNDKFDEQWATSGMRGSAGRRNQKRAKHRANLVSAFLAPNSRVLEIGPGTGHLLTALRKRGHDVTGLDQSEEAARAVENRTGIRVHATQLENLSEQYDAIVSFHVIEHVNNPFQFYQSIQARLNPGGAAVIATPNHLFYDTFISDEVIAKFFVIPAHRFYFSPSSLGHLVERGGGNIEMLSTIESQDTRYYRALQSQIPRMRGAGFLSRQLALAWGQLNPEERARSGIRGTGDEVIVVARATLTGRK